MEDYREKIGRYLSMEKEVLDLLSLDEINEVMNILEDARINGRRIFICGNGGSASTASHLECDFNKGISYDQKIKYDIECLSEDKDTENETPDIYCSFEKQAEKRRCSDRDFRKREFCKSSESIPVCE